MDLFHLTLPEVKQLDPEKLPFHPIGSRIVFQLPSFFRGGNVKLRGCIWMVVYVYSMWISLRWQKQIFQLKFKVKKNVWSISCSACMCVSCVFCLFVYVFGIFMKFYWVAGSWIGPWVIVEDRFGGDDVCPNETTKSTIRVWSTSLHLDFFWLIKYLNYVLSHRIKP